MRGRKRVVAREVQGADVEAANRQAAALTPADIYTPEPDRSDAATVIDPSTLGQRYRRSGHQKIYRWTQVCTIASAALSAASVVFTMLDDVSVGRRFAMPAVLLGAIAVALAGRTSLSARWRGWAIAAAVFGGAVLALTWMHPMLFRDDPSELTPKLKQQQLHPPQ